MLHSLVLSWRLPRMAAASPQHTLEAVARVSPVQQLSCHPRRNRMKASRSLACFAALCFCVASMLSLGGNPVSAQSTTDGAIGGTVIDSSGAAVPNAKVTAKNSGTNAISSATTDDTGYFRIGKLAPAEYSVTVDATGMAPFTAEHVTVLIGSVTELTAKLNVASAGAVVEVSAEIPVVNTTSQEFSNVVSETAISNLPINNG